MRRIHKLLTMMSGGGAAVPWWLAGGVAPSTNYGIYQAIGAADIAASYVNLANPGTNNITPGATPPAFDTSYGWLWDGVTHNSMNTNIIPTSADYTMLVRYSDCVDATFKALGGQNTTNASLALYAQAGANTVGYQNGNALAQIAPKLLSGVLGIAGNVAYRNGVAEAGVLAGWSAANTKRIYVALLQTGVGIAVKIQAVAIYNIVLTPVQVAAVTARMAALPL